MTAGAAAQGGEPRKALATPAQGLISGGVRPTLHIFMVTIGTAGDVYPMIGLGRALRSRGHRVSFAVNERFEAEVRAAGLDFRPLGNDAQWRAVFENPRWYHPRHGLEFFFRTALMPMIGPVCAAITDAAGDDRARDDLVVVAAVHVFGAHIAHRRHGIPFASVCLQPSTHRWVLPDDTLQAAPKESELALRLRAALRFVGAKWLNDDAALLQPNGSAQVGLFPQWFAITPAAWPERSVFSGFPLYDGAVDAPLPPEADAFFARDEPVVLINPGSNVHWARDFCAAAVAACERLGCRAALLTRYGDQVAIADPQRIRRFDFLPLGPALSRAAAMIHHGGISTVGRCLAAGVPQLLAPLGYDHPDNAHTLEHLGVAINVGKGDLRVETVAAALDQILQSPAYRARAQALADKMSETNDLGPACLAIEGLVHRPIRMMQSNGS